MKALAPIALLLTTASAAAAQPSAVAALPRADVQAAIGWQNLRADRTASFNNWINSIAFVDAGAGWYWTEHLRTQIDAGLGSSGRSTRFVDRSRESRSRFQEVDTDVRPRTFAVGQQYQFFHNALFHPHVGAGVLVRSEHVRDTFSPLTDVDPATGRTVIVEPGRTETRSRTRVVAFADAGFKAYVSRRAFFVSDARFAIRSRVDGVLLRFGFGVDF